MQNSKNIAPPAKSPMPSTAKLKVEKPKTIREIRDSVNETFANNIRSAARDGKAVS